MVKSTGHGFKWSSLQNALQYVDTKYIIFLDDDTYSKKDYGLLVGTLDKEKGDISSVQCFPSNVTNTIERLQDIEYRVAMLGRQNRRWITSGACICAKTSSMKKILNNHSGYRDGGDIEIGLLSKKMGMKYIHTNFEVFTEIPSTIGGWFSQRRKWMGGNFRHTTMNLFSGGRDGVYLIYFFILLWTHIFVRYYLLYRFPITFGVIMICYIPVTLVSNLKIWKSIFRKELLLYPLYALFQIMFISIFGIYSYIFVAIRQKNYGFIKSKGELCIQ